jgi:NTE family protein
VGNEQAHRRADGVFEGGGVKGIAFAGAVAAAEQAGGVREWVNVAGTSAGAIVASMLVAGYDATDLHRILKAAKYDRFPDCGVGGVKVGGVFNAIARMRGAAPGLYFKAWLGDVLQESPLARRLGKKTLTFGDVKRTDLPPQPAGMTDAKYLRARYRLTVIASGITSGQMLILPEDLPTFEDQHGNAYEIDEFPIVDAVRMSMSYPFLFTPVEMRRSGKPYFVVDGGLLSNFPIWLFDSQNPARPTWGFRLHPGSSLSDGLPYRNVPRPFWEVPLLKAMFSAATEAWDRREELQSVGSRTVSIPTLGVATTDFNLSPDDAAALYSSGLDTTRAFFSNPSQQAYINSFGHPLPADDDAGNGKTSGGADPAL